MPAGILILNDISYKDLVLAKPVVTSRKSCKQRGFTSDWKTKCSPVVSHDTVEEMASLPLKGLQRTDCMVNIERARVIVGKKPCY